MIFLEQALDRLESLEPEVVFTVNSEEVIGVLKKINEEYGVSLDGALVFSVVGELMPDELPSYFQSEFGFDSVKAKAMAKDFIEQVLDPLARRLLFLSADPDKKGMTLVQEKSFLIRMFEEAIIQELKNNAIIKHAVNLRIFNILEGDENFKRNLGRVLLANNELLGGKNINVASKSVTPTISNWLSDYISIKGGEVFDTVSLSDYLANSANARSLSQEDKSLLSEVIQLYRNLQLFPQSTANKSIDEWQILPYGSDEIEDLEQKTRQLDKQQTVIERKFDKGMGKEKEEKIIEIVSSEGSVSEQKKLAKYDWPTISGLERRLLLEELGVSRQELEEYLKSK
ncbi:MAG: hypothetical protein WC473_01765 [Patescibacteria group bacterium]